MRHRLLLILGSSASRGGPRRTLCALATVAVAAGALHGQPPDWKFERGFRDALLYLHPIADYSLKLTWERAWRDRLFSQNSIRGSFGSVTLVKLLCEWRMTVNERLVKGLWFRLEDRWYAGRHVDGERASTFVGVEQYVWKGVSLFCYGDLAYDKEDADILFGGSVTDAARQHYVRAAFLDEDQFFDEKNSTRGVTIRRPLGAIWAANLRRGPWSFFTEGRYSTGFRRRYPDTQASPDLRRHDQRMVDWLAALSYGSRHGALVQLSLNRYGFSEMKLCSCADSGYDYANSVWVGSLAAGFRPRRDVWGQIGAHAVNQDARSAMNRAFTYDRREIISHAHVEVHRPFGIVELSYMGSFYDWDYVAGDAPASYARAGYVDKVKLGYSYSFGPHAIIQLSISHVVSIEEFGGGNAQFLLFF